MENKNNNSKKAVIISLSIAALVSLIVAFIMSRNLSTDVSKMRFKLTKDYKALKDTSFEYDPVLGQRVYTQLCAKCHGSNGLGSSSIPPLMNAPLVIGEPSKLIKLTLYGLRGKLERGDITYNGVMPGFKNIPHDDLAHALSYVRETFGENSSQIPTIEIVKGKIDFIEGKTLFTVEEL